MGSVATTKQFLYLLESLQAQLCEIMRQRLLAISLLNLGLLAYPRKSEALSYFPELNESTNIINFGHKNSKDIFDSDYFRNRQNSRQNNRCSIIPNAGSQHRCNHPFQIPETLPTLPDRGTSRSNDDLPRLEDFVPLPDSLIEGTAFDVWTGEAVAGVTVVFTPVEGGERAQVTTDEFGRYRAPIVSGIYKVTVRSPYLGSGSSAGEFALGEGGTTMLNITVSKRS